MDENCCWQPITVLQIPILYLKSLWSVNFASPHRDVFPAECSSLPFMSLVLSQAVEGWIHSFHWKLQPFASPKDLAICCETGLSSLQPQGMLLLACLIAGLIKTWRAVSNMISPAEQLKLLQHFCACVWYTPWIAETYGFNSWFHESEQTWAAQAPWLFDIVSVPDLSLTSSWEVIPSDAGRSEHMSACLLQNKVQQADFVVRSPEGRASEGIFCFLHFLNASQKIQTHTLWLALWS